MTRGFHTRYEMAKTRRATRAEPMAQTSYNHRPWRDACDEIAAQAGVDPEGVELYRWGSWLFFRCYGESAVWSCCVPALHWRDHRREVAAQWLEHPDLPRAA